MIYFLNFFQKKLHISLIINVLVILNKKTTIMSDEMQLKLKFKHFFLK